MKTVGAAGAVCIAPSCLLKAEPPPHQFHKGTAAGTFRPVELQPYLTESKLNECLQKWEDHRGTQLHYCGLVPSLVIMSRLNLLSVLEDMGRTPVPSVAGGGSYLPSEMMFHGQRVEIRSSFVPDDYIIVGRVEQDAPAATFQIRPSDRSRRLVLTDITEPA